MREQPRQYINTLRINKIETHMACFNCILEVPKKIKSMNGTLKKTVIAK